MVLQGVRFLAPLLFFLFSRAADRCTLSRKPGFLIVLGGVRLQRNGINNTEKKRTCRLKPTLRTVRSLGFKWTKRHLGDAGEESTAVVWCKGRWSCLGL